MRCAPALAVALIALATGCAASDEPTDGIDDPAVSGGKEDGTSYSACELGAVVTYLNEGGSAEALEEAGVHSRAAEGLAAHRDGSDRTFGTADDDLFDDIAEVDAVPYVGPAALRALVAAIEDRCTAPADPYAEARDVTRPKITIPAGTVAPTEYGYPEDFGNLSLGGTEFWQKWTGGHNPTYSFEEGTDAGRLCMQAAAIRFEAIMVDAPAKLLELETATNWDGSFFNWNDDYSQATSGDASGSRLWAWQTYLIKWISQTGRDGSCYLPTREMVERAATACLATGAANAGEIQGCSVR
jgi:hypothetical protein